MADIGHKDLIFAGMSEIYKRYRQYCFASISEDDLTLNEAAVLHFLSNHPKSNTVKDISQQLNISKGLVSRSVESLRQKQLLITRTDAEDRRKVLITLCEKALPYTQSFQCSQEAFTKKVLEGITEEELASALRTFRKMSQNIMEINEEE